MTSSSPLSDALDLERDLPTTAADVVALRRHRPTWPAFDLTDLERLSPPVVGADALCRRPTFPSELPPFEL